MRVFILLAVFLAATAWISPALLAQEETLVASYDIDNGGYGAIVMKLSSINDKAGLLVGARRGWIIDHTFAIGIAGYGLASNVRAQTPGPYGQDFLNFGYGGLDLEYIINSDKLIHFSVHSLIGVGVVGFRRGWGDEFAGNGVGWDFPRHEPWNNYYYGDDYFGDGGRHQFDVCFVIEPGVNLDINITRWMRTSIGASYRSVSGVRSAASTNADLSGPSGMLTFRFGSF